MSKMSYADALRIYQSPTTFSADDVVQARDMIIARNLDLYASANRKRWWGGLQLADAVLALALLGTIALVVGVLVSPQFVADLCGVK